MLMSGCIGLKQLLYTLNDSISETVYLPFPKSNINANLLLVDCCWGGGGGLAEG